MSLGLGAYGTRVCVIRDVLLYTWSILSASDELEGSFSGKVPSDGIIVVTTQYLFPGPTRRGHIQTLLAIQEAVNILPGVSVVVYLISHRVGMFPGCGK